jgi:hypothetical protein
MIARIRELLAANKISVAAPAAASAISDAEATLGFSIPHLLKLIYLNVGNGGFGPGYGIIGVAGGHASNLGTLVETYDQIQKGAKYLRLDWQAGLLPFCEWGCNIFSCVACDDENHQVFTSEECRAHREPYQLKDFLSMWLKGVDILNPANSHRETADVINPFSRQKTRVSGARKKGPDATQNDGAN